MIWYFDIRGSQLILMKVTGSKTVSFSRVPQNTLNNDLQGYFRTTDNTPVWIGPDKVYLCNGSTNAHYTTDRITTFQLNQNTLQDNCSDAGQNTNIVGDLGRGEHYRLESAGELMFYSRTKREAKLLYHGPFKPSEVVVPAANSAIATNNTNL
jgi:hypothetical protein